MIVLVEVEDVSRVLEVLAQRNPLHGSPTGILEASPALTLTNRGRESRQISLC